MSCYEYILRLSPEQYAVVARLIIENDARGHDGLYMDLPTKAAFTAATFERVVQ